jgi:anti-sigma B factor antagonist
VSVTVTTRRVGKVTVVDAAGRITAGEGATSFRETIRGLVSSGQKKLLLNLSEISYMDSSGIGELMSGFTTLANQGGMMKLLKLSKRVRELLESTRLYTVFEVYDDERKALASFQ